MNKQLRSCAIILFSATAPTQAADSMFIDVNGNVGLGTSSPTEQLHVVSTDGTAQVFVDEQSVSVAPRTLFRLSNAGNTKFELVNTDTAETWAFASPGSEFRISKQDSGVVELTLDSGGNLLISGTYDSISDRDSKTGIETVDSREVLAKVAELPVSRWRYKDDSEVEHIGPMAQDFHAAFGVGASPKKIATIDTSGVALAAIQGLNELMEEKEARIEQLEQVNAALAKRLESLETALLNVTANVPIEKPNRVDSLSSTVR